MLEHGLILPGAAGRAAYSDGVYRVLARPALMLAIAPFQSSIEPLPKPVRAQLGDAGV